MEGLKVINTVIILSIFLILLYDALENNKIRNAVAKKAACSCTDHAH